MDMGQGYFKYIHYKKNVDMHMAIYKQDHKGLSLSIEKVLLQYCSWKIFFTVNHS